MNPTLQRKLILDDAQLCVLLTVGGVREQLPGFDEDDVLAAVLDHTMSPAFDLGMGGRRDLRVSPSAVEFYRKTGGSRRRRISDAEMFTEVLRGCSPHGPLGQTWIAGERVRMILNCSSTHLINLIDDGELEQMPGTNYRRGPNGSAQIPLASFKGLLKRRLA